MQIGYETNEQGETIRTTYLTNGSVIRELAREEIDSPPSPRYISVGSFFDRFGDDKWPILASTDPLVQALVKDCTVRIAQGINLDRPDVADGIALLQSKGFANVTAAVITDPILESEKP